MRCAIWYHLYNLKSVKITHGRAFENTRGGVLLLVILLKITLLHGCFHVFKIVQMVSNRAKHLLCVIDNESLAC